MKIQRNYAMTKEFDLNIEKILENLKENFFNIYDENSSSKDNAITAFKKWKKSIPKDAIYDKFRELAATVHRLFRRPDLFLLGLRYCYF